MKANNNFSAHNLSVSREINIWIDLLIDHARFIRNSLDPTEEELFQEANNFSKRFVVLKERSQYKLHEDEKFMEDLQTAVRNFIDFKIQAARGVKNCRILSILPAPLIEHVMVEAIYFYGILSRLQGESRPTWEDIGLPDNRTALTVPLELISGLPNDYEDIAWEQLLFWTEIQYEHAEVLSLYFRPNQQEIRRETLHWSHRIQRLHDDILSAYKNSRRGPEDFIEFTLNLMNDWRDFLRNLFRNLNNCTIPGKQMNIWPQVVNHMWRETIYFIQALQILSNLL
mgnify:CR=1 FL=1